ncbi:hypothetical protein AQ611_20410 [Burkholderia singularis]|nr:hypothetical protein AQ611_20410 [Burkholderia sp. Bp7605]
MYDNVCANHGQSTIKPLEPDMFGTVVIYDHVAGFKLIHSRSGRCCGATRHIEVERFGGTFDAARSQLERRRIGLDQRKCAVDSGLLVGYLGECTGAGRREDGCTNKII